MNANPQLDYVKEKMEKEIKDYTQRRHLNRNAAFAFTVVPATLAALATISIGASEKLGNTWLPILAMIATGIASILGAWESLFSNRKLWRVNNVALAGLYALKFDIEYREKDTQKPITQAETDQFFAVLKHVQKEGEDSYQRAVGHN